MTSPDHWKKCNLCKKPIGFLATYYVCNVSTCNRKKTGLTFCSVTCWDAHVPSANHRESWAVERKSPSRESFLSGEEAPAEKIVRDEKEDPRKDWPTGKAAFSSKPAPVIRRRPAGEGS